MAPRQSTAPRRKRSKPETDLAVRPRDAVRAADQDAAPEAAAAETDERDATRRKLIDKFRQSLQDNSDLDEEGRNFLMEHYRNAVESAPLTPSFDAKPDRGQWVEMLETLRDGGYAADEDVAALIRQFDAAMAPLDSPKLRTLAEFSERCERDGQQAAVEWLESKREALEESKRATAAAGNDARLQPAKPQLRRSRSPRGPPA